MTTDKANKIYDILEVYGNADGTMRDSFVCHHTNGENCTEWRFEGKLGFGGKYRSDTNSVDCYLEDETPERLKLIEQINKLLKSI